MANLLPTYSYRPIPAPTEPAKLRSASTRRGRLFAGGTYFRSIESGRAANNITIQLIKEDNDAYLIVTNKNLENRENVIGPVVASLLDMSGSTWSDLIVIDQLDTTPRAQYYSIRCSIAFARQNGQSITLPPPTSTHPFSFGKVFSLPGKLAVKTEKTAANFDAGSTIFIAPRVRIYKLLPLNIAPTSDPVAGTSTPGYSGWDIANLRAQVNANNPWIEMMPRSGTPATGTEPPVPLAVKFDEQDDGVDDPVASLFPEQSLRGADGLPSTPTGERTGPYRSIIHVNYSEKANGALAEANAVYEWAGVDSSNGDWVKYQ